MRKDEDKVNVFDEEDLVSPKENMNYDFVILRHLDKITTCTSTIAEEGKKEEFISLIRLLDSRIRIFGIEIKSYDYKAEREKINNTFKKQWEKREEFWTKHKKPHPTFGNQVMVLSTEGEKRYRGEKLEHNFMKAWDLHDAIMEFLAVKGKLFERRRIGDIGKSVENNGSKE